MSTIIQWATTILVTYGIPILFLMAFAGSLGIPFPITPVIMAAGALAHEGYLDWRLGILACLVGASLADQSEFMLGRFARGWIEKRYGGTSGWQRARSINRKQGGWAIFITRFWMMPLAPAVNLLAGSQYPYLRFTFLDLFGQLVWVLVYGGMGYIFLEQWSLLNQAVSGLSGVTFAILILGWVIYTLVKKKKHNPTHA